jgi:hypothetical protein
VIDITTGEAPALPRSFVRALVLGIGLYVPLLGWLLVLLPDCITLVATDSHRALHDLLARTVVVVDPRLDAAGQRVAALAVDADELRATLGGG